MNKYYFIDDLPQEIPGNYAGVFVDAVIGTQQAATLDGYLDKLGNSKTGFVHKVRLNADNDIHDNFAWFKFITDHYGREKWDRLPAIIDLYKSGCNLDAVGTYVGRFVNEFGSSFKPLLYVTKGMWDAWALGGPNAESVARTILVKADLLVADYSPTVVEIPSYLDKVEWLEAQSGIIYNDPLGEFAGIGSTGEEPPAGGDPGTGEPPVIIQPTSGNKHITGKIWFMDVDLHISGEE